MLYLNDADIRSLGANWQEILRIIQHAVECVHQEQYRQPVKPYLRYKDLSNRIIAMPAYLGGSKECTGIKWIASFPKNIDNGLQRAHSVTILNEVDTGRPICVLNTNRVSGIRTAGVSGIVVEKYLNEINDQPKLNVGIIGFGPIGALHLDMISSAMQGRLSKVFIYDLHPINKSMISEAIRDKVHICQSWEAPYKEADIFITCTTSQTRYITGRPKAGSLQLNVSLRDYMPSCKEYMNFVLVDDWDEVCRENTDIQMMHQNMHLAKEDTISLAQFICEPKVVDQYRKGDVIMFNPMGMAVFDVAVGNYYYEKAIAENGGLVLTD